MDFNTPPLTQIAPFDARFVSKTRKKRKTKKQRKHVCKLILVKKIQCQLAKLSCANTAWSSKNVCSLCHRRASVGSKSYRQVRRQSVFEKFRFAYCTCCAPCHCFASCHRCHDSFIVRSAQTRPPFTGFTQLAHPSRCSRSTLTTVCYCARVSVITSGLCVYIGSATPSPDPS